MTTEVNIKLAYDLYKKTISEVIANIEVYEHDLPERVMGEIAEFFQVIAAYETELDLTPKAELLELMHATHFWITQALYKHAICLFIGKIHDYKKLFQKFEYKGVVIDEVNFYLTAKEKEKEISKQFIKELKTCYGHMIPIWHLEWKWKDNFLYQEGWLRVMFGRGFRALKREPYIPINELPTGICFEEIYSKAKALLKEFEAVCPEVINNGRSQTLIAKLASAVVAWIIPIAVSIPVVKQLIDWFGKLNF